MQRGDLHRRHRYHVVSWSARRNFISEGHRGWYRMTNGETLTFIPGPVPRNELTKLLLRLNRYLPRIEAAAVATLMKQTRRIPNDD